MTRALRDLLDATLPDPLARARAYAAAGITAWSGEDDLEALRRTWLYWRCLPVIDASARGFTAARRAQVPTEHAGACQ